MTNKEKIIEIINEYEKSVEEGNAYSPTWFTNQTLELLEKIRQEEKTLCQKKLREQREELQSIVQRYFKNILKLPCPDFRYNLKPPKKRLKP